MCEIVKALTSASGIRIKAIIALVGELQILLAGWLFVHNQVSTGGPAGPQIDSCLDCSARYRD
jgi:hypothetical protein